MASRRLSLLFLLAIAVVMGLWMVRYLSPQQVIRRQIARTIEAFEQERILGVATTISRSYQDDWGMSYETVLGHVQEAMDAFSELAVALEPPVIEVDGDTARVRLRFVVAGTADGERGSVVGTPGQPVSATQLWRKEPPGWRVVSTEALDIPELRDELDLMHQPR